MAELQVFVQLGIDEGQPLPRLVGSAQQHGADVRQLQAAGGKETEAKDSNGLGVILTITQHLAIHSRPETCVVVICDVTLCCVVLCCVEFCCVVLCWVALCCVE